jgi:hypothetical protein
MRCAVALFALIVPVAVTAPALAGTAPDLEACSAISPAESETGIERTGPLPVPNKLAGIAVSSRYWYAVATLGGGTACVDTSWMESLDEPQLSRDGRFLSFGWSGYEAYGYMLVDRSGAGQAVETGEAPRTSPSGKLLASVEYSESGFGSLNGLGVWRIEDKGLRELAIVEFRPDYTDWRFEGWINDGCIALSATTFHDIEVADYKVANANRHTFLAEDQGGWRPHSGKPADCGAP